MPVPQLCAAVSEDFVRCRTAAGAEGRAVRFRLRHFRRRCAEVDPRCSAAAAAFLRVLLPALRVRRRLGALRVPFFGACPQLQALTEPQPAPTVWEVVLIQAPLPASGGGRWPRFPSPRGSRPDQGRGLLGRRARCSSCPSRHRASCSPVVSPGQLWPSRARTHCSGADLFALHTGSTRLAFNLTANEGYGAEKVDGMPGSLL